MEVLPKKASFILVIDNTVFHTTSPKKGKDYGLVQKAFYKGWKSKREVQTELNTMDTMMSQP